MNRSSLCHAVAFTLLAIVLAVFLSGPARIMALIPAVFAVFYLVDARIMRHLCLPAAVLMVAVLLPGSGFAADTAPVTVGSLFGDVRPILETVLGTIVTAIVGLVMWAAKRNLGLSIDAKMRDALQSALQNGVHLGLDAVQGLADAKGGEVKSKLLSTGILYARRYAPDAIAHFGLHEEDLADLVQAQLSRMLPAGAVR